MGDISEKAKKPTEGILWDLVVCSATKAVNRIRKRLPRGCRGLPYVKLATPTDEKKSYLHGSE